MIRSLKISFSFSFRRIKARKNRYLKMRKTKFTQLLEFWKAYFQTNAVIRIRIFFFFFNFLWFSGKLFQNNINIDNWFVGKENKSLYTFDGRQLDGRIVCQSKKKTPQKKKKRKKKKKREFTFSTQIVVRGKFLRILMLLCIEYHQNECTEK